MRVMHGEYKLDVLFACNAQGSGIQRRFGVIVVGDFNSRYGGLASK